jgi:3',5'-cyclic AMP phosphodiesterase CpdA
MLVAQLTDLHLAQPDSGDLSGNRARFQSCLDTLQALSQAPDFYLVTGDIAERGEEEAYRFFLKRMHALGRPWLAVTGNHDNATRFTAASAGEPADPLRHMGSARVGSWRIVGVDTAAPGMDGGWFDDVRATLLARTLDQEPDVPTLVAMHHPPVVSGVEWIDPAADASWIARFRGVISRFRQVRQIVCGHAHMPVVTTFCGVPTTIAPATAAQLWPDFAPFDPRRPDGRIMVVDGQPGFALHRLGNAGVATTFAAPASGAVRLRHEALAAAT